MKFQMTDQDALLSKVADSAINVGQYLSALFVKMRLNEMMPPLPEVQRIPDNMIGDGTERSMKLRKGWSIPREIPISGLLNTETAARLGTRALGGTRSSVAVTAATSYDVTTLCQTKLQGRVPKLSTLAFLLGGYDFIWPSMGVRDFGIAFDAENNVTFNANLINTGIYRHNAIAADLITRGFDAAYAAALENAVPIVAPSTTPEHHLMHPAATRCTFSNGVTIDFGDEAELLSGTCSLNNNIVVRQLPKDPFLVPTKRKSGAYARDIHRGKREPLARIKISLNEQLDGFLLAQNGTDITSLIFQFGSDDEIGATPEFYEFEWKFPVAEIETVQSDTDGDDGALTMSFYPKTDAVTGGYVIQRIRTGDATIQ